MAKSAPFRMRDQGRKMKIFVVDDDPLNRKYLRALLTHEGHSVIECEDGLAALERLYVEPCSAIISDVLMPRMDGYRLCHEIRKSKQFSATPIILYTATYLSAADEKAAMTMGADKFLRKPARPEAIVATLNEVVESNRHRRAKQPKKIEDLSALREYSEVLVRKLEETNIQLSAANNALRESEERLRLAATAGNIGMWEWTPATDKLVWSDQHKLLLGLPADAAVLKLDGFLSAIVPEDRPRVREALQNTVADRAGYEIEYRVSWPDKSIHWISSKGRGEYDDEGGCIRVIGVALDITRRKEADETLRKSEARFREMADQAPVMIWQTGADGLCTYLNKQWRDFTGQTDDAGLGFGWLNAVHPDDRKAAGMDFLKANECREDFCVEYRLLRHDGEYRWVIDSGLPRRNENGELLGYIGTVLDISARKQAEELRQRNLERVRALNEISVAVTSTMNRQSQLEVLLEKIETFLPYPTVSTLRLFHRESGRLESLAYRGLDQDRLLERETDRTLHRAQRVVKTRAPVIIADIRNDAHRDERSMPASFGLVSYAGVPLIARDEIIGVLCVYTKECHEFNPEEVEFLMTLAGQAAIAIQNAQLYEQAEHRRREAEELGRIGRSLTETLDLNAVGERVVASVPRLFGGKGSTLRLRQPDGSMIRLAAAGEVFAQTPAGAVIANGFGLASRAFALGEPVWSTDILKDPEGRLTPEMRQHIMQTGNGSIIAVPFRARDNLIGLFTIIDRTGRSYSESEVGLLRTFAVQVAFAVQNARLYEDIERAKKELETTNASLERSLKQLDSLYVALAPIAGSLSTEELMSGIIDRVVEATGADAALIRFGGPSALPIVGLRGFPTGYRTRIDRPGPGGAVDWVVTHGEPIIAPDIAEEARMTRKTQLEIGMRSCAILPVTVHGKVRGILHIASRNRGYFSEDQRNHLMAIARQMSIAMENRELFDSVKSSRDELSRANTALQETNRMLAALHAVADAASQSLDLDRVLERAIEKIIDIFDFEASRVHLYDEQSDVIRRRAAFEKDPELFAAHRVFKKGDGLVGEVVQSGEALIFEDIPADPRYRRLSRTNMARRLNNRFFAVFPIRTKARIFGALSCVGTRARRLTDAEVRLLEALTDQLAVAIENNKLYEDISLKVAELQRKTAELERANKVKDEFLGVVSHELRTPINVILGYTALFTDGVLGEIKPAQRDALAKIGRETQGLLAMINGILSATTMESEPLVVEAQKFRAEDLLAELEANWSVTAPGHLTVHWDYPTDLPVLKTDRRKLRQILDNIIGNAVKFTEQGIIVIIVRAAASPESMLPQGSTWPQSPPGRSWLEFKVRDTGVGIPRQALTKVFDKFYQADSSDTRRYGGVGMGLYIARKFTLLLGGAIAVESTEGKGSTFTVMLPCGE
jgi:PAS domain S-box-containing protein